MDLPWLVPLFKKVWLLIKFFISFIVAFNQIFLIYVGNLVTSKKYPGYGMEFYTPEPESTRECNEFLINLQQP